MLTRSQFLRSVGIVLTAMVLGPLIGGIVFWIGGVLFDSSGAGVPSAKVSFVLIQFSYVFGLLPAFCFGVLFSVSAFRLQRNSIWAALTCALVGSLMVSLVFKGRMGSAEALFGFFQMIVVPSCVAGLVCWLLTKPLHRSP